ncbi:MAG: 50S ribosomal protein L5 [Buchnera aphidicola (Periphyllus lyropictus)]|uniref:50S ribosomal protein L5 n=1 Tax=Buchnera aphidicola TaxID=9 RepID=UPI001ED1F0F9|nr:50S ribosomal protein L5 [Buchnera aphidicola]NIH16485.1 50S ribosomal protein L5 [Buchnera aphidicola (Periphyllus lyropictus)]USS94770.1 50S ribosomal protein L5 [Buchnera aphidicola (Periphyllus lyropictus)]
MLDIYNFYKKKIVPKFIKKFHYTSVMQVPKIIKITLNMGVGECVSNKKKLDYAVSDLALISGQKPVLTKVRKSVAGFKIRQGYPIGCKVTLRGVRKWHFLSKLINIVMPRIRDFRGFSKSSFDGFGNYNFGIKEQIIFPEIDYDKIDEIRGLDISILTTAKSDLEAFSLLSEFNFPFKK